MARRAPLLPLPLLLLLAASNTAVEPLQKTVYVLVDSELTLEPSPVTGSITDLLWKHNDNLVAVWADSDKEVLYYGSFRGRATLDQASGRLTIKNMAAPDSGRYTVEVNNKLRNEPYDVKAVTQVPQAVIRFRPVACTNDVDNCTMICGVGVMEGAEPVTYSWKMGDGDWFESKQELFIGKTQTGRVETFRCQMSNPVSKKESDSVNNPFYVAPSSEIPPVVWIIVGFLSLLVIFVLFFMRNKIISCVTKLRRNTGESRSVQPTSEIKQLNSESRENPNPQPKTESV